MNAYNEKMNKIHDSIKEVVGGNIAVFFSAYDTDEKGLPINNLSEQVVSGNVKFVATTRPFWGEGGNYESHIVKDPTWLDIAVLADAMIRTTGDSHHIFLEGIHRVDTEGNINIYEFSMGS